MPFSQRFPGQRKAGKFTSAEDWVLRMAICETTNSLGTTKSYSRGVWMLMLLLMLMLMLLDVDADAELLDVDDDADVEVFGC